MKTTQDFLIEIKNIYKKHPYLKKSNTDIGKELKKINIFLEKNEIKKNINKF